MDVTAYLARLGFTGPLTPNAATLRALHRAHLYAVPFENLDIALGRPIALSTEALFDKLVVHRRGGYCYEANGLFAALLRALGFRVDLLAARVYDGATPGPEFDHLCLLVHLETRWLADVGFGDSFQDPLPLDLTDPQPNPDASYRLCPGPERYRLEEAGATGWAPAYDFTLTPRALAEFEPMNQHQQTSPASIFTHKRVCTRPTPEGRVTFSSAGGRHRLIITRHDERTEIALAAADIPDVLTKHFGLTLPATLPQEPVDER